MEKDSQQNVKKFEIEKNAQFMFPTYKSSKENAGHLNLKLCPKQNAFTLLLFKKIHCIYLYVFDIIISLVQW